MLWTTNQPAELNSNSPSPPQISSISFSSSQFIPSFLLILLTFAFVCPLLSALAQPNPQMLNEPEITSNLSELYTKEPNWSIGDFDERKQPKKRKDNQLTSRYGLRIDHCPEGGEPELDSLNGQVKLCQLDDECRPSYKCQNIIGLTHFGKQMRYCCPTKTTACTEKPRLEPIIPGHCRPLKTFYYFDVEQLACVKARMAQCEDFGRNRFASILECRTKCETTACELGESILLHNASFDKPFLCDSDEDCPVGYNCRPDRIFRRNVCCGFLDFEPCPLGFRSFTVPFSGRPKGCISSDTRDECPTDYVCTQNQINQEHYCCTVENGVCPEGHQAYIHPLTDGTIKCNLKGYESTTACPPGYACLAAVFGSSWGFCCSQAVVASCPDDSYPQINSLTNQPQRCEMMQPHACAKGFVCESDSVSHLGFCCSIPRKFTRKKTHPPELIPRKKVRPTPPTTTMEPEEEEEQEKAIQVTEETTMALPTTQGIQPPFIVTTTIRGKRRGDWRGKGKKKKKKKKKGGRRDVEGRNRGGTEEEEGGNETSEEGGPNPSSSSDEKSFEKHELTKLSTKLDRFITGIKRRTALPKGHRRPKPRIWKLKKGKGRGQEMIEPPAKRREEDEQTEEEDEREEERSEEKEEREEEGMARRRHPRPRCPSHYRAMAYPGTKWTYLECLPEKAGNGKKKRRREGEEGEEGEEEEEAGENHDLTEEEGAANGRRRHHSSICPKPAICLRAKNDPFRRALCCLKKREEGEEEEERNNGEGSEETEGTEEEEEEGKMEGRRRKKKKKKEREEEEEGEEEGGEHREEEEEVNEKEEEVEREKMAEELANIKKEEEAVEASVGAKKRRTKSPAMVQIAETTQMATTTTTTTVAPTTTTTTMHRGNVLMVEKSNDPACPRLIADRICVPGSTQDCKERGFFCQFNKEKRQFVCCSKK